MTCQIDNCQPDYCIHDMVELEREKNARIAALESAARALLTRLEMADDLVGYSPPEISAERDALANLLEG